MLAPRWVFPRLGPLLRGGIDLIAYHRQILLLGLFQPRPGELRGWDKALCLLRSQQISESAYATRSSNMGAMAGTIVTFSGPGNQLADLQGWEGLLLNELRAMTRPKWLALVDQRGAIPIGINVRLGNDFHQAQSTEDYYTKGAIKTPLKWFREALMSIRAACGFSAPAVVVSDGSEEDLRPLLELENVSFARPGCAISDLLTLAQSKILIASGASSFSAWAAFLGQMPAISHPGQPLTWFGLRNHHGYFVETFDPVAPDQQFLEQARTILIHDASNAN